jgi:hypothetical protein
MASTFLENIKHGAQHLEEQLSMSHGSGDIASGNYLFLSHFSHSNLFYSLLSLVMSLLETGDSIRTWEVDTHEDYHEFIHLS